MKRKFFCIYLPIILGVLIYIIFRSRSLFYFHFFTLINLDDYIIPLRKFVFLYRKLFPNWVIYSLPDGLWLFSFGSALLYNLKNLKKRALLFSLIFSLTLFFELIQFFLGGHGTLIGTFDPSDLVCFATGYALALSVNYLFFKKNQIVHEVQQQISFLQVLYEEKKNIVIFLILAFLPTLT